MKVYKWVALACASLVFSAAAAAPLKIEAVVAHPIFNNFYTCSEHFEGQLKYMGDALGADCSILSMENVDGREFSRAYRNDGKLNEDWYSWGMDVLSPCDCSVDRINVNDVVNLPGIMGKGPATSVTLKREDGVKFVVAHLGRIDVKTGDKVTAGQLLGIVGNNGYSRAPHIHIGAFKDQTPYQIRFDQSRR